MKKAKTDERRFRAGRFSIDGEGHYPGYFTKESWNGWTVPYFEKETADRILVDPAFSDPEAKIEYSAKRDAYIVPDPSHPGYFWVVFAGVDIQTEDGPKHVYSLGGCWWIWDVDKDSISAESAKEGN